MCFQQTAMMDFVPLAASFHILLCAAWARHSYMDSIPPARSGKARE